MTVLGSIYADRASAKGTVMRMRVGLVALALVVGSCTADADPVTTTASPTTSSTTTTTAPPTTSEAPTTTVGTSSTTTTAPPNTTPIASGAGVTLATSAECQGLAEPQTAGTVTWSDDERLWEASADGETRCLAHVDGVIDSLLWGPTGDRALVNGRLIVGGPNAGAVAPADIEWTFTYPTGLNLVGIQDGAVVKWIDGARLEVLDAIDTVEAVAYHPSGLHIAVGGAEPPPDPDLDTTEGIFIADSSGNSPVNLVLGFDVEIRDIAFSNDASRMYFVAAHDDLVHFHSIDTVPFESEDGFRQLGSGAEEFAVTYATSSGSGRIEFDRIAVHHSDPALVLWTTGPCAPEGSRGFQVFAGDEASVVQALGPASALGFLGDDPATITVAAVTGPCEGPRDVGLMSAHLETGEVDNIPLAGNATAAAVRASVAPHLYDLVDVEIVGFA